MLSSQGIASTPSPAALRRDAQALARAARRFARDSGADDTGEFEVLLQRVLSRPEPHESDVVSEALGLLVESGDEDCIEWLLEEIEIESELQFIALGNAGHSRVCLLFAIPVVLPAFTEPPAVSTRLAAFQELHDVLEEHGVIGADAKFQLLPRLFAPQELRGRPYGDFMRLARHLGLQLIHPYETDVSADAEAFPPPTVVMPPPVDTPYVTLRYLVGLALTTEEGLKTLFPPLEDDDMEDGPGQEWDDSGQVPNWAESLAAAVRDWSGVMQGVLAVGAPTGLHADIQYGFEMAREHDCRLRLQSALDNAGLARDDVALAEFPLAGEGCSVEGMRVVLLDGEDNALEETLWPVLPHESLDEAIDKLHLLLTAEGYAPADELLSADTPGASYLLH